MLPLHAPDSQALHPTNLRLEYEISHQYPVRGPQRLYLFEQSNVIVQAGEPVEFA
jgi:hypothetical protein